MNVVLHRNRHNVGVSNWSLFGCKRSFHRLDYGGEEIRRQLGRAGNRGRNGRERLNSFEFSPFYWAGFVAQRERAQQDSKVPYKVPHLTHPPFTYERQPQHRDHPTLIRIVRGFFNVPQNYQHSRNCETGPPVYRPYPRRLESLTICR